MFSLILCAYTQGVATEVKALQQKRDELEAQLKEVVFPTYKKKPRYVDWSR